MKFKVKRIALCSILLMSVALVGCVPFSMGLTKKYSDIESVVMTVLDEGELVSIKETELNNDSKKKDSKKDLTISLNLLHSASSVALDNALLKCTRVMDIVEETFEEEINDYKFIINTNTLDVYGNEQKVKILEVSVDNKTVDKINFLNFNYKNLEKISEITKFGYLVEDEVDAPKDNTEIVVEGEDVLQDTDKPAN